MTPKSKTYNYSDRNLSETMCQKGNAQAHRVERKAEQNAACNRDAKRLQDCAYLAGHGWIAIA